MNTEKRVSIAEELRRFTADGWRTIGPRVLTRRTELLFVRPTPTCDWKIIFLTRAGVKYFEKALATRGRKTPYRFFIESRAAERRKRT